jgi:DNA polymerase elongation subunit (family B)
MLLLPFQVNRYAGKDVSSVENEKTDGALFIRGIESERRDVPQFVRMVCKSVLQEILLKGDMDAAVDVCKHEIRRLLSGKCSMMELVMTGVKLSYLFWLFTWLTFLSLH